MIFSNRSYKILYSQLADVGAANPGPRAIDMLTLDRPTIDFPGMAKSFGVFVPIYFAIVGYRLSFGNDFSASLLLSFLVGSSLIVLVSVGLASKFAGFRGLDVINLAIVSNARGGPGIILASIAFDAGLISGVLCTALVITALFTSQMAGWWLRFVLHRGWPLLSTNPEEKAADFRLSPASRPLLTPEFDYSQGESRG